jgi:hypothetical protein
LNEKGNDLHESDLCDLEAFTDASETGFGGYVVSNVDNTMHVYNSLVLNLTKLPKTACIEMI